MRLQRYHFQLTYVPGKEVPIADALSRAGSPSRDSDDVDIGDAMCAADCHCMTAELRISDPTLQELRKETARDANMQELMTIIQTGWPDRPSQVPLGVRPFYHLRSELVTEQGLVFKGHRCVVPSCNEVEHSQKDAPSTHGVGEHPSLQQGDSVLAGIKQRVKRDDSAL